MNPLEGFLLKPWERPQNVFTSVPVEVREKEKKKDEERNQIKKKTKITGLFVFFFLKITPNSMNLSSNKTWITLDLYSTSHSLYLVIRQLLEMSRATKK